MDRCSRRFPGLEDTDAGCFWALFEKLEEIDQPFGAILVKEQLERSKNTFGLLIEKIGSLCPPLKGEVFC